MKKLNPLSGSTLIEVLVGLVLLTIATMVILSIVTEVIRQESSTLKGTLLLDVFYDSVNEAKGYSRRELPAVDTCWIRIYSLSGNLISTTKDIPASDSACLGNAVKPDRIVVIWRSYPPSKIAANFSRSDVMKLPRYFNSIIQLDLIGKVFDSTRSIEDVSITIYKN